MTLTNNSSALRTLASTDARQPALLQRSDHRRNGPARQSQRPHHPVGRGRRQRRGHVVQVGHLPLRRAFHRGSPPTSTSPASRPPTTSPAPTACGSASSRPAVDPDRRRRVHRRHQLHDARRACRAPSATARRRRSPTSTAPRRSRWTPSSARRWATRSCAASSSGRRTARSPASSRPPDRKALFVNIQHPGEGTSTASFAAGNYISNWPGGGASRPRSATIVITRNDGGEVGGGLA